MYKKSYPTIFQFIIENPFVQSQNIVHNTKNWVQMQINNIKISPLSFRSIKLTSHDFTISSMLILHIIFQRYFFSNNFVCYFILQVLVFHIQIAAKFLILVCEYIYIFIGIWHANLYMYTTVIIIIKLFEVNFILFIFSKALRCRPKINLKLSIMHHFIPKN